MTTEKEQLEAEIAERDARIEQLSLCNDGLARKLACAATELAALKAQQPSADVACALMSALEGIVHDQRVPNEVSQECAAVLIEARRPNPNPARSGVVLPDLITELKKQADEIAREGHAGWGNTMLLAAEALSVAGVTAMLAAAPSARKEG